MTDAANNTNTQGNERVADRTANVALDYTVDVETPELVMVSYTIAGVGSRVSAAVIDYLICFGAIVLVWIGLATFSANRATSKITEQPFVWATAILVVAVFAVFWLYYVLFEALADGQTPGKRTMHLRVVRDGGLSVTFGASAVRNLVRLVDMQPFVLYGVGLIGLITNSRGKRLGDLAAGTLVVKEGLLKQPAQSRSPRFGGATERFGATPRVVLHATLSDSEFALLDRFLARRNELDITRREQLGARLSERFASVLDSYHGATKGARLIALHDAERISRGQGAAGRNETGAARERHAIIANNAQRWSKFASRLATAKQDGLKSLGEDGVRRFVQEYRDLAADLARLRTATRGQDVEEVFYLNRLVSTAHNLLYRRRSLPVRVIVRFLFVEAPREIRASVRPILLAALLMFAPTAIAWMSIVQHPAIAATLLPPGMLERAEDGVKAAKTGRGYVKDPGIFRPVMATSIITNNVQVSFAAFAGGITAGIFTVWILISNGISIGAVFGLYQSRNILTLLVKFVAPHGVLELTAICIGGGAGLLLAAAMLIPGNRTRRRALVENGKRAITLVGGATFLLLIAGSIEGFVSPIETWTLAAKLSVSATTALLLAAYLSLGRTRKAKIVGDQQRAAHAIAVEPANPTRVTTAPLAI